MSLYDCNSCSACGGNCDRCTATVCLKNMESHKEIYKLTNEFDNKFHQAAQNLYDRCIEIKNNLLNNYGINIDISSIYDTILCEDFLLKMAEFSCSKCAFIFLEVGLNGLFQKNKTRLC